MLQDDRVAQIGNADEYVIEYEEYTVDRQKACVDLLKCLTRQYKCAMKLKLMHNFNK